MLPAAPCGAPGLLMVVTSTAVAIRAAVQYAFVLAGDSVTRWTIGCPDAAETVRALDGASFVTTPNDPPDAGVMLPATTAATTAAVVNVNAVSPSALRRDLNNGLNMCCPLF
jgi:hypothetical protein